ncbi:hypothetical protein [Bacteroides faecis]|uniref:hypothetical protein n=1 Tax=Bacteroides faecis TaxID=674529 RepID=UPI0035AB6975
MTSIAEAAFQTGKYSEGISIPSIISVKGPSIIALKLVRMNGSPGNKGLYLPMETFLMYDHIFIVNLAHKHSDSPSVVKQAGNIFCSKEIPCVSHDRQGTWKHKQSTKT